MERKRRGHIYFSRSGAILLKAEKIKSPNKPPNVFSIRSSTSNTPQPVSSCTNSKNKLIQKAPRTTKKLRDLELIIIDNRNPIGMKPITFPPRLSILYSVRNLLLFENNWIVLKGLKLALRIPSRITFLVMDVLNTSPYLPLKFLNKINFDKMIRKQSKSIPAIHRTVFSFIIVKAKDTALCFIEVCLPPPYPEKYRSKDGKGIRMLVKIH